MSKLDAAEHGLVGVRAIHAVQVHDVRERGGAGRLRVVHQDAVRETLDEPKGW